MSEYVLPYLGGQNFCHPSVHVCIHRIFFAERAGAVTSIGLALTFHSASISDGLAGFQPNINIVMPMKLLLSCLNAEGQQVNFNGHLD